MRTAGVVELDPVADRAGSVLDAFEAVSMQALLFQRLDDTLDHTVLLWAMRGDELLAQAVAADQGGVMAAGEDQAIACWERYAEEGYGRLRSLKIAQQAAITGLRSLWWFCQPHHRGDQLWPRSMLRRTPAFW